METERVIYLVGACCIALAGIVWKDFSSIAIVALTFTVFMESSSHQRTRESLERMGLVMAEFLRDCSDDGDDDGKPRTAG